MMDSKYDLANYRIVNPTNSVFSAAEVRISTTTLRFNNLTAAELRYPQYVRMMINDDCTMLAIQACDKNKDGALPFMKGRTAQDLTGQKKWTSVTNRMLAMAIREMRQWEGKDTKRIIGIPWQEQNAIIFNLQSVMAPKSRTPMLTSAEVLRTYKSAVESEFVPMVVSNPIYGRGNFGVIPTEVIEADYQQVM